MIDIALPLWRRVGTDARGGFFEAIDASVHPIDAPRRTRLVARQLYVWSIAYRFGWDDSDTIMLTHGWEALQRHINRTTGLAIASATDSGEIIDSRFSRYDHAFLLLSLAELVRAMPTLTGPMEVATRIRGRLMHLIDDERSENDPEAFQANPLMHLFEAFLAWTDIPGSERDWQDGADRIARLALTKLYDPAWRVIPEVFDKDWAPARDRETRWVEPGHLFEWATLLLLWNQNKASVAAAEVATALATAAEKHGIGQHGFVVNQTTDTLQHIDVGAKLWQQCERLRYHCTARALQQCTDTTDLNTHLDTPWTQIRRFLSTPTQGLWYDSANSRGEMIALPAKASSLYHLCTALMATEEVH